jgi:hypothetical protein
MLRIVIYGERCSGTNYLENLINLNFINKISDQYGSKHFFGFYKNVLKNNSNKVLFICIVRDLVPWINSFFREKHHLPLKYKINLSENEKIDHFLNKEIFSINDYDHDYKKWDKENMDDRNIYTGKRYKNIFELRHTKIKWMLEDLPKKVKNYIFIRYEDLINDFENTMNKLKDKGLIVKHNIDFPLNTDNYKNNINNKNIKFIDIKNINKISDKMILNNKNLIIKYEKELGYL